MPDKQQTTQTTQTQPGETPDKQQTTQTQPIKFDDWLKGQAEEIKAAYEQHTSGLKTALANERTQRGDLEKQLRDMAGKAAKGSEDEKRLTEMANQLAAKATEADFYDQAHRLGVSDLKLAFLAAQSAGLIDAKGRTNFDELKRLHPQLFGVVQSGPRGNAGAGTGGPAAGKPTMNDFIRKSAGRT